MLAIGEWRRNTTQNYAGRVYLYKINPNGTAQLTTTIDSPNLVYSGYFGFSVDLSGDRLAIGARGERNANNITIGAAYLYKIKPSGDVILYDHLTYPNGRVMIY